MGSPQGGQLGERLGSESVRGSGAPASAIFAVKVDCVPLGLRVVPAHRLLPLSLPLLHLDLPRRPQGLAGWARGEGRWCQVARLVLTENCPRCTRTCECACFCATGLVFGVAWVMGLWSPSRQA